MDAPPPTPKQQSGPPAPDPLEQYHAVAETVGFVPNLRPKDNLWQAVSAAAGAILGALLGLILMPIFVRDGSPLIGALVGGVLGLIAGVFVSGLVIMVLGWVRQARRK